MESSLGDIIFIVLIIAISIISSVAKAKKKAHATIDIPENSSEDIESNEEVDVLQKIDDWLNKNVEVVETTEVNEPIVAKKTEKLDKTSYVKMESLFAKEYEATKIKKENKNMNVAKTATKKEEDNNTEIYEWFSEPEDLQKAFIYSEILKRPNI